jgi:hypothetical protein
MLNIPTTLGRAGLAPQCIARTSVIWEAKITEIRKDSYRPLLMIVGLKKFVGPKKIVKRSAFFNFLKRYIVYVIILNMASKFIDYLRRPSKIKI